MPFNYKIRIFMNQHIKYFLFDGQKPDHAKREGGTRHNKCVLVLHTVTVIKSVDGPGEFQRRCRYDFKTRRVAPVNDEEIFVMSNENSIWKPITPTFGNGTKTYSAFCFNIPRIFHTLYIQTRFRNIILNLK
jgi:hypothetical protein